MWFNQKDRPFPGIAHFTCSFGHTFSFPLFRCTLVRQDDGAGDSGIVAQSRCHKIIIHRRDRNIVRQQCRELRFDLLQHAGNLHHAATEDYPFRTQNDRIRFQCLADIIGHKTPDFICRIDIFPAFPKRPSIDGPAAIPSKQLPWYGQNPL